MVYTCNPAMHEVWIGRFWFKGGSEKNENPSEK
jgi:hypothetical protein